MFQCNKLALSAAVLRLKLLCKTEQQVRRFNEFHCSLLGDVFEGISDHEGSCRITKIFQIAFNLCFVACSSSHEHFFGVLEL